MDSTLRLIFAYFVTRYAVKKAYKRNELSHSASILAIVIGIIVTWSSFCHFAALLTFYYISNIAFKYKKEIKQKINGDHNLDGQRDFLQVLCIGFFPLIYSLFYLWECGSGERSIEFTDQYTATKRTLAVLAALACSCGDRLAYELGSVFPESEYNKTYHLISMKQVRKGTNGGVSLFGTLASILGGFIIGLAFYAMLKFSLSFTEDGVLGSIPPQWPVIFIGAFSGLFGSLLDSILGELFQYSGYDYERKVIVERPGPNVEHISGKYVLNNKQVNFISIFISTWFVPYLAWKTYKNF